jgi:hypothetical protein
MSEKDIEREILTKGKTAPRVTPEDIEAAIVSEWYFTAGQAVDRSGAIQSEFVPPCLDHLTFCVLVLQNGFTVTGESACASPENFDEDIGRKIARENARSKIWALEGYLLRQALFEST